MNAPRPLRTFEERPRAQTTSSLLHGLTSEESLIAVWKMLFCPPLRSHFGAEWSLEWCKNLVETYVEGNHAEVSAQYNTLAPQVQQLWSKWPKLSMQHPPWALFSLDMRTGVIPWVSFAFERSLLLLFSTGAATEKHFGDILPLAFITSGGPGDSKDTAIRICAPSGPTRASAEYWLTRAYLVKLEDGMHATLEPDGKGRTYSMHEYTDLSGQTKRVFFETTHSLGREEVDFLEFLHGKQ